MPNWPLTSLLEQRKRVFYGWWIAIAGAVQDAVKGGTFDEGFLFYLLPITRDLNISRAAVSLPFSMARLESAFSGPIVGYLIDRFGPRWMLAAGGFLSGLGFVLLAFTHNYTVFLLVFVGVLSVGFQAGYSHPMLAAINTWFIRRRGLAMSVVSNGDALVVFTLGWRTAALMSGVAIWAVVIPLALVVKRSPESMGLLPDGDMPRRRPARAAVRGVRPTPDGNDYTVREAAKTPAFWVFTMAQSFRNAAHGGIIVHIVPVLVWKGIEEHDTAFFIVFMLFTTMVMRILMGYLGDLWSRPKVASLGVCFGVAGLLLLLRTSGHWWELAAFVYLLGAAESVNSTANALLGDLFGRRNFATLRGWTSLVSSILPTATPVFSGIIFDRTGGYNVAVLAFAASYVVSALLYWNIPKPSPPESSPTSSVIPKQEHQP